MIDDIVFAFNSFILEKPALVGGQISGYSLDGGSFDFTPIPAGAGEIYF